MARSPATAVFLNWVADRFVNVYDEPENVDFVKRLRHEASKAQTLRSNLSMNERTYQLFMTDQVSMDGTRMYLLQVRNGVGKIGSKLRLTTQQAGDLARQLDAAVDYFND